VFANRVASESHHAMLAESLPAGLACFGWLARDPNIALPERHLGIVQASEIADLDSRIATAAAALKGVDLALPPPVSFRAPPKPSIPPLLEGVRVAVARDAAFAFLYRANLDLLRTLGAGLVFFSPLEEAGPPPADALYLPGGYPELHLDKLAANRTMNAAIRAHHALGKPIIAECGGMLYLLESLTDIQGHDAGMVGLLPGRATMQARLGNLGLHAAQLPEGELRGHTFHYSSMTGGLEPIAHSRAARHHGRSEPVYRRERLTASYLHWYFPSNPAAAARLFLP
jgi:cobyrinic acid a,c-diamide synthase